jgi:hypothetical protein
LDLEDGRIHHSNNVAGHARRDARAQGLARLRLGPQQSARRRPLKALTWGKAAFDRTA